MAYSDILVPRQEVLRKEGIEGVIDIENLRDQKKKYLESRAEDFFDLTYPTSDLKLVLDNLHRRFNSKEKTAGLFLLEGFKGSGKSHLELFVYHLFTNPSVASHWLSKNKILCSVPRDATVLIHKFTDFPIDTIWSLVFEKLGAGKDVDHTKMPNLDQLRKVLAGKHLVLILDELEMGITMMNNDHIRAQNLGFLQMLSEEAHRSDNASITILASVYDSNREPGATLKRVPKIDVKFTENIDRQKIVLHRLFSNYLSYDKSKAEPVIQSYVNEWKRHSIQVDERYITRFVDSFPFTPELLEMLLHRVLKKDFQGTRGPLGLLGTVVRNTYKDVDVISSAHLDIKDPAIKNRLADLDPSQTILQCAQNDLNDLSNLKFSQSIISSAFAGTLTSTGSVRGISEQELARQVIKPGDDINSYNASLQALEKYGTYFQHSEGNYFFDVQEKPNAKVEYRSLRIDQADALEFALNRWKNNVFNDSAATIYRDPLQTKTILNQGDKNNIRFVLSPKRLVDDERKELYRGIENRNQVIIVEPRSDEFNALENQDIVKWAQRAKAAMELQSTASDSERKRQYEKIANDELRYIDDTFKKAGLYYISVQASSDGNLSFEKEPVGSASTRLDLLAQLQQNIFPRQMFEEHIQRMVQDDQYRVHILGKTVSDLRAMFKKTLGFPVLISDAILIDALKGVSRSKKIGLQSQRARHCGTTPSFSSSEWNDVQVVEPFEDLGEHSSLGGTLPIFSAQEEPSNEGGDTISPKAPNAPKVTIQSLQTTNVSSLNVLRQEVAAKLAVFGDVKVVKVRYVIFFEGNKVELSTLPSALRGSMSGNGDIHLELDITKEGEYSKAQLEQLTEQLPNIRDAVYRAELRVHLPENAVVGE